MSARLDAILECVGALGVSEVGVVTGVGTLVDPAEAWEALAARGLIPMAWARDPRRAFVPHRDFVPAQLVGGDDDGEWLVPVGWPFATPRRLIDVVALAQDPAKITQAEALAREACKTLGVDPDVVVWLVEPAEATTAHELHQLVEWRSTNPSNCSAIDDAVALARSHRHDEISFADGAAEPTPTWCKPVAWSCRVALRDLVNTGFALDSISEYAVVLVCPTVSEDG